MNSSRRRHGFTFVEVLAALVFMGVLMPVVISAILSANRASITAERQTVAMQLAENKLSELTLNNAWSAGGSRGDFGKEQSGYSWALTQTDWTGGAMTQIEVEVTFTVQGQPQTVRLATLVNSSLTQPGTTDPGAQPTPTPSG